MSETVEKFKLELSRLSTQERAALASFLINSLGGDIIDDDVEVAWDTELSKRLEDIYRRTAVGELSDQVFPELRKKYS